MGRIPVLGALFKRGTLQMAIGVGTGAVAATVFTPMVVRGISKVWAGATNPNLTPLWKVTTGALLATVVSFLPFRGKKDIAGYVLVGGGVAAAMDLLQTYVVPRLPAGWQGYGDYVQLPYSGYGYGTPQQVEAGEFGDYVQLPYSGMGTPQQVEAGEFGHADDTGTFAPSF